MEPCKVTDINIAATRELPAPAQLLQEIPRTEAQQDFVAAARREIHRIIFGNDKRLLLVVGPCSIHDIAAGREYARKLAKLSEEVRERILIVMRVYFEKPRTTVGWKGLIMDPYIDKSYNIPAGLRIAREFLREVIDLGLPTATELLDPITPQYIADLICWSAIGARTTESQTHRQMASGLSMPLGFKNSTDGSIEAAVNAINAASREQTFLGIDQQGRAASVTTKGNPDCHLVLRGGKNGPNYDAQHVTDYLAKLKSSGLVPALMVDCSHDNACKDYTRYPEILADVVSQLSQGQDGIIGAMVESNLNPGSQKIVIGEKMDYGVSITDPCVGWDETEKMIRSTFKALENRFSLA
ncbi:3-deoxy-7-phosphoheptulonate synthase [Ruficoccus amylovorans]|uniref:Phospho-2-dehydro-3-deoxyheptonate aldolase n=1 Tax=Ruficoccus amylovorans TaxID=1804625 RepID=A0A842HA38_9BACT|nr:3-deoxy-7-phosphoheptulonate synthase [Ruficoccus amylovorans]MBC2593363.1 3-deoxy-7-phosphoheptulonate synthase [Ruficoccus amylovorans]